MLTDKRQILATAAVMAGIVMTAGTVVAEVATHSSTPAAPPAKTVTWQPPAVPLSPAGAQHIEDGEST